jgi:hypothetical protein
MQHPGLVIDASIARASGGELATYPQSVNCSAFAGSKKGQKTTVFDAWGTQEMDES